MKPKKNHVFCRGCNRSKMLFESQTKADNFIKFNKEDILEQSGKAPVRSYYCSFCGGWHVTSNPSVEYGELIDQKEKEIMQKVADAQKSKEEIHEISVSISMKLGQLKALSNLSDFDSCHQILEECQAELEKMNGCATYWPAYIQTRNKIMKQEEKIEELKELYAMSPEEREKLFEMADSTEEMKKHIQSAQVVNEGQAALDEIRRLIEEGKHDEAKGLIVNYLESHTIEEKDPLTSVKCHIRHKMKLLEKEVNKACESSSGKLGEVVEEVDKKKERYTKEDKEQILDIIHRIETIKEEFENEDYESCEDHIEIVLLLLEQLSPKGRYYAALKSQTDFWSERIAHLKG